MNMITMTPIGYVQNNIHEKGDEGWGKVESVINLDPVYKGGLTGLADFSHAMIITFLHEADFNPQVQLVRRPRGLPEMPLIGIFSQRNKDRPNAIGVTTVRILSVMEDNLTVSGLDAIDGTPVLDIKPYFPKFDCRENAINPDWVEQIMEKYF